MPRRAKHTGYVASKPRADGLWPCGVTLPDGAKKRMYGRTREDAESRVAAELRKIAEGRAPASRDPTVEAFALDWLERRTARKRLAPSTVVRYTTLLTLHVFPRLGKRKTPSVGPADLERLYDHLERKTKLSGSTVHRVHSLLHVIFKDAERRGMLLRNPCDLIDAPVDTPRPRRELAVDAVVKYLKAAQGHEDEALLIVAAEAGLRQGELFGLRISDLDLDEGYVSIREDGKVQRLPKRGIVRSAPKTDAGVRRIAIGGWAVAALRAHLQRLRESGRPNPHGLVWPNRAGGYRESQTWNPRVWRPFLRAAGIEERTEFRELTRKVHASVAVAERVDPVTLRHRMGHTDAQTTLDHYAKLLPEADRNAADAIDRALRRLAAREA